MPSPFRSFAATDQGLLPRLAVAARNPEVISIHLANGTPQFQAVLFFLQALFAIGLLIGYRTRLITLLSWLLLTSLHARFRAILGGGDEYLRILLFWSLFLPLGARYSVDDALLKACREIKITVSGAGTSFVSNLKALLTGYQGGNARVRLKLEFDEGEILGAVASGEFNQVMRADHGTSTYVNALQEAPGLWGAQEKFSRPMWLTAALWLKVSSRRGR